MCEISHKVFKCIIRCILGRGTHQAPVVQTLDSAIHWISHYPLDNSIGFTSVYPLDSDLSAGQRYPSFEQLGPVHVCVLLSPTCIVNSISLFILLALESVSR